jgi:hypothetical protein
MRKTDLFIVEEHHEAFLAWHHALKKDLFHAARKNTLLHVDYHADMKACPCQQPIPELSDSIETIRDFTYSELTIASFIVPAVYQKLFYEICWLIPKELDCAKNGLVPKKRRYLYARTYQEKKRTLIMNDDPFLGFSDKPWQDRVPFCFYCQTVEQPFEPESSPPESSVILDIDLDYFACAKLIDLSQKLEITPAEFQRCKTEKYRTLNLQLRYMLEESEGRYYLHFNPKSDIFDNYQEKISQENTLASIQAFIAYLKTNAITPALITLCRSRYSGYTPEAAWQYIEDQLVQGLSELFAMEVHNGLDDLNVIL